MPSEDITRVASGKRRGGVDGQRFEIDLKKCPPFRGDNELGLTLHTKIGERQPPWMEELEIVVGNESEATTSLRPVKIYIAVDSEGPTGVDEYWARNRNDGDPKLEHFRGQGETQAPEVTHRTIAEGARSSGNAARTPLRGTSLRAVHVIPFRMNVRRLSFFQLRKK